MELTDNPILWFLWDVAFNMTLGETLNDIAERERETETETERESIYHVDYISYLYKYIYKCIFVRIHVYLQNLWHVL